MTRFNVTLLIVTFASTIFSTTSIAKPFDWSNFDALLRSYVSQGTYQGVSAHLLDYNALLNNPQFQSIATQLEMFDPTFLKGDDKLAFYINTYNYYAIKIVIDNWPVESIKDIGNLFKPVWKKSVGKIDGKKITLDEIEHKILRPMGEPRIHFAIVCASMSCPDLRTEIYSAPNLDSQLDDQVKRFLENTSKGAEIENEKLYLSEIFSWFKEDFEQQGGVNHFVGQYNTALEGFENFEAIGYNWQLNNRM